MGEKRGFDINTATHDELTSTFQIDGTRAAELIDHRPYSSWDEVK